MTELAKRFFDGRTPTKGRVSKIFSDFDADGDGLISLDEMVEGAQTMYRAFHPSAELSHDHLLDPVKEEGTSPRSDASGR